VRVVAWAAVEPDEGGRIAPVVRRVAVAWNEEATDEALDDAEGTPLLVTATGLAPNECTSFPVFSLV